MYLFYDSNGILQEQINDSAIVEGETSNIIYCYFDGLDLSGKKFSLALKKPDGTFITPKEGTLVTQQIPYNAKRDLRYFEYYTDYQFIAFTFDTYSDFDVAGLYVGNPQISGTSIDFYEPITFNVESNNITANKYITSSQFAYLLSLVQGNVYSNGVSGSFDNNVLTVSVLTGTGATAKADITLPFSDYLPLSGGTMSGDLILYGGTGNQIIRVGSIDETNVRINKKGFYAVNVQETTGIPQNEADYLCSSIVLNQYRSSEKITLLFPQSLPNSAKTGTFATQEWVNNALLGYYTTTETDTEISNALSNYSTTTQVNEAIAAGVNALLSSSNTWTGANSFTTDPTYNGSPFVAESTFATVFNSSAITANDIVSKLGSTPVQQATHALTADSASTVGQAVNSSVTFVSGSVTSLTIPFVAGSSYYGVLLLNQNTSVDAGSVGASIKFAGVTSTTAFSSDTAQIAFRIQVSYLRATGQYCVVLENANLGVRSVTLLTSAPSYLVQLTSAGSSFTAQGTPSATIRGTLAIVS
jgi:hypothetical protein